jgi:hypothetical protein
MTQLSNNDFDRVFRERLGDLSSTPSGLNWVNIEAQLGSRKPASTVWKRWSLVALLLLIGGAGAGGWWMYYQERAQSESLRHQLANPTFLDGHTRHTAGIVSGSGKQNIAAAGLMAADGQDVPATTTNRSVRTTGPASTTGISAATASFHYPVPDKAESIGLAALHTDVGGIEPHPWFYLPDGRINETAMRGLRLGPVAQYGLTGHSGGLQEDISRQEGFKPLPALGVSYGLALDYDFGARWGLELQWLVSSVEGQHYTFNPDNGFRSSPDGVDGFSTRLNYIRLPLAVKYRIPVAGNPAHAPRVWNLSAGLSYGRLNWVNLEEAPATLQPRHFNTNELGILAGISHDWYLGRNYLATLGLRSGWSNNMAALPAIWNTQTHHGSYYVALQAKIQLLVPAR